jgi:D-aminopeptidase
MSAYPKGPRNSLTDVRDVRVGHLTRVAPAGAGRIRTGITSIFLRPPKGQQMRPAAVVAAGGGIEVTGLCFLEDFGVLMTPIVAASIRAVGRVHDAMVGRRYEMDLGWPPTVVGFNDAPLNDVRSLPFTEAEVGRSFSDASSGPVVEGAVGIGAGLVAFGFKSGVGSASRIVTPAGGRPHTIGALAALNLGRRGSLRLDAGAAIAPATAGPARVQGSAFVVAVTDAPLDDRQCRRVALGALQGLARIGATPGAGETVVAFGVSTGVLLTRNDRSAAQIDFTPVSEAALSGLADAAAEAAEESARRSLSTVAPADATPDYPVFPGGKFP